MSETRNISVITGNALCTACGGCAGICPVGAITMERSPAGFLTARVDEQLCVNCGKCLGVCPGSTGRASDDLVGEVRSGYVGYASGEALRQEGQSGGVVTALLLYLLEKGLVDGCVLTRFDCETKRAQAFLASTREEILSAQGSVYCQSAPVELALKHSDKRLAAVVLGCQGESLARIRQKFPKALPQLYIIGLICGGNLSDLMVEDLLRQGGIGPEDTLRRFRFRDKARGWPGDITMEGEKTVLLPKQKRMERKPYYQNYRCLLCAEKMNLSCDLVVGDPWGIALPQEEKGYSAVLARTQRGEELLRMAEQAGYVCLREHAPEAIVAGQQIETELAKRHTAVKQLCREQGWPFPYEAAAGADHSDEKYRQAMLDKLRYTRALQACKTAAEAKRLIRARKRKNADPVKERLYQLKKKFLG